MLLSILSSFVMAGTVDGKALQAVVRKNHPKIMGCYAPEAKADPKLQGDVIVNFLLVADGSAKKTKIKKSDLKNKKVETCIVKVFSALSFPKPEGGNIDVNYPLAFSPAEVEEVIVEGPPKKPGSLPPGAVREVIGAQKNAFQQCYEQQKMKDPNIKGTIVTEFVVELDGSVTNPIIKDTQMNSKPVEDCILGELKKLQFPKPDGETGVRLTFPFNF